MFPLMARLTRPLPLWVAMTLVGGDMAAQGGPDAWRPQTVPLFGASYPPGIGLLLGVGVVHTRYGFRALPPSTQLLAEAAYATGVSTYRIDVAGEFRRPLLPTILYVEMRASGLEFTRFYGVGNTTVGSRPDSAYRVRQTRLLVAPRVAIPLTPRLRFTVGPLLKYAHTRSDPGTVLATTGPYYGAGDFGQVGVRAGLALDTRDHTSAPAAGTPPRGAGSGSPGSTAAPTRCRSPRPGVLSARRSTSGSGSCSDATMVTDTSAGGVKQRSGEQDEKPQHEARGRRPAEPTPCGQRALAQGNLGT